MTSSDTLLEYEAPAPSVGPSDPPPDPDESAFMDLFTKSGSFKDTEDVVCDYLLPAADLTNGLGHAHCDFRAFC